VLDGKPGAGLERLLGHPAELGDDLARHDRGAVRVGEHVAAADVDVVLEANRHRLGRDRGLERPLEVLYGRDAATAARRKHDDLVAGLPDAAGNLPGVTAVVVMLV